MNSNTPAVPDDALPNLVRYSQRWDAGEVPDANCFRAHADQLALPDLLNLVLLDQRRRWARGAGWSAETYFELVPGLGADTETAVAVVYNEFLLREPSPRPVREDECLSRFPHLAERLRVQFDLHRALQRHSSSGDSDSDGPAGTRTVAQTGDPTAEGPERPAEPLPVVPGYEILALLGRGGMGVVYRARHLALNRVVALKMVSDGFAASEKRKRFRHEAEALARLQHPNVVQIHDIGEHDGRPFLALEYVTGGTLADRAAGAPQPPQWSAGIVEVLARAVHAAHQSGFVHRDLKPTNVLLTPDGTPKVTDFGLARDLTADSDLTHTGVVLGTPSYMAPEQATGRAHRVGPAADVYALGAMLYELLTGRPPFRGETALETVQQVVSADPVAPRAWHPAVPRDLETVCLKCLQKRPGQRYPTAEALAEDLGRFRAGRPILARPVGSLERAWRWCLRNKAVATFAALAVLWVAVAVAALAVYAIERGNSARELGKLLGERNTALEERGKALGEAQAERASADRAAAEAALEQALTLGDQGDPARALLWLADALRHASAAGATDLEEAVRYNLAAWERRVLPLTAVLARPGEPLTFSPDGRFLAVRAENGLELWDWRPDRRFTLANTDPLGRAVFSPDGLRLATLDRNVARIWEVPSARPEGVTNTGALLATIPDLHWDIRFDTSDVLLTTGNRSPLRAWSAATGQPLPGRTAVTGDGTQFVGAFALVRNGQTGQLVDTRTGRAGPSVPVNVAGLVHGGGGGFAATGRPGFVRSVSLPTVELTGTGDVLFLADERGAGLWDPRSGKSIAVLTGAQVEAARFSPDGRYLVTLFTNENLFRSWDGRTGASFTPLGTINGNVALAFSPDSRLVYRPDLDRIVGWDLAGGVPSGATGLQSAPIKGIALSSDGQRLATGGGREVRIWTRAADDSLRVAGVNEVILPGSSDGTTVLTRSSDGTFRVIRLPDGAPAGPPIVAGLVSLSPDGRRVVTTVPGPPQKKRDPAPDHIRLVDVTTGGVLGEPIPTNERFSRAAFCPDGRRFFTATARTVHVWDVETRRPVGEPIPYDASTREAVGFSPDGEKLTVVESGRTLRLVNLPAPSGDRTAQFPARIVRADFRPDGRFLLVGCADGSVHLWDVENWRPAADALAAPPRVYAGLFAPDGKTFLAPSWDRRLVQRRVPSAAAAGPAIEQAEPITEALFVPAGQLLATASEHGVRLWHAPTARRIGPVLHVGLFRKGTVPTLWCAGTRLVAHARDGSLRGYPIERPAPDPPDRVERRVQALTGLELRGGNVRILDREAWAERRREFADLAQ
jgi:WD40 repeat protein